MRPKEETEREEKDTKERGQNVNESKLYILAALNNSNAKKGKRKGATINN